MNISLVKKLVEKGVIRHNTELEASYMGVDMTGHPRARVKGNFFLQGVSLTKEDRILFSVKSVIDGAPRKVFAEDVHTVDGMLLENLASIYGIDASGGAIAQGKRRGRKPRAKLAQAA